MSSEKSAREIGTATKVPKTEMMIKMPSWRHSSISRSVLSLFLQDTSSIAVNCLGKFLGVRTVARNQARRPPDTASILGTTAYAGRNAVCPLFLFTFPLSLRPLASNHVDFICRRLEVQLTAHLPSLTAPQIDQHRGETGLHMKHRLLRVCVC